MDEEEQRLLAKLAELDEVLEMRRLTREMFSGPAATAETIVIVAEGSDPEE